MPKSGGQNKLAAKAAKPTNANLKGHDDRSHSEASDFPADHSLPLCGGCGDCVTCKATVGKCYKCPKVCLSKLIQEKAHAVLHITSTFIFLGSNSDGTPITTLTGDTPLGSGIRADLFAHGNGFFIKNGYIICPAHLIFAPPTYSSAANLWPFNSGSPNVVGPAPVEGIGGVIHNEYLKASRIVGTVNNVNGSGCSYAYELRLIGADVAGDYAVLRVEDRCGNYNCAQPKLQFGYHGRKGCHPYFDWGCSRQARAGDKVYLFGDYISSALDINAQSSLPVLITKGIVSSHRWADPQGYALAEGVVVSAAVYANSSGLPIINAMGEVIAMQTADVSGNTLRVGPGGIANNFPFFNRAAGTGLVAGPSEKFMHTPINRIIKGPGKCGQTACHIATITQGPNSFYAYVKGYLGVAISLLVADDFGTTVDYTSGSPVAGQRRTVVVGGTINPLGAAPVDKRIRGAVIKGIAGLNPNGAAGEGNGAFFVPGGVVTDLPSILPNNLPVSSLAGKVAPGDLIESISVLKDDGNHLFELGGLNAQVALALVTWLTCPGDRVILCIRRGGNALNAADNSNDYGYNYKAESVEAVMQTFAPLNDWPWYAINKFPALLSNQGVLPGNPAYVTPAYPGFPTPLSQLANPAVPQLLGGAEFRPSL